MIYGGNIENTVIEYFDLPCTLKKKLTFFVLAKKVSVSLSSEGHRHFKRGFIVLAL